MAERIIGDGSWFIPNMTGVDAEKVLEKFGFEGGFLVRSSSTNPGHFTLTCMHEDGEVIHIKIQNHGDYYDLYGGKKFATLKELLQYYIENEGQLKEKCGREIRLRYPIPRPEDITDRWLHGRISGKDADILLRDKKNNSFLVRESPGHPRQFVLSVKIEEKITHVMMKCKDGQFDIGDGDQFDSLSDLIGHYRETPLIETSGTVAHLERPINVARPNVSAIITRACLLKRETFACKVSWRSGCSDEFEILQQIDRQNHYVQDEGKRTKNIHKNRCRNIVPFDYTRVILEDGDPEVMGSDYINASYINTNNLENWSAPNIKTQYIATQDCLEHTVVDFWRMIWQENCRIIAMTTNEEDIGQEMCATYWPGCKGKPMIFDLYIGTMTIKSRRGTVRTEHRCLRELEIYLKHKSLGRIETRTVYQYQFLGWPTNGIPDEPGPFLNFLQETTDQHDSIYNIGPIVVHCSSGIGGTGTFIVLDMILKQIKEQGLQCEIDIQKIVQMVRTQQSGMIQTETQYKFVYSAVEEYIKSVTHRTQYKQEEDPEYDDTLHLTKAAGRGDVKPQQSRQPPLPKPRLSSRPMQAIPAGEPEQMYQHTRPLNH